MRTPEQTIEPRRDAYEVMKKLEEKGLGHFNEDGEWAHDFIFDPKTGKMIPESKTP